MLNNNQAIVRKITGRALRSDKRRNFFIVAAITLTAFMITSVFSVGMSYYESVNMRAKRLHGSVSHMAFAYPTSEQLEKVYTLDYIKAVGIGAYIAVTPDIPQLAEMFDIGYVDKTQWDEMLSPAFTGIIGAYPAHENEIMLSRHILGAMGIENPNIGMEIPLSYIVNGTDEIKTTTFILSCIYTEYASNGMGGGGIVIYVSPEFAEKFNKLTPENIMVNVIFNDAGGVAQNTERLRNDLLFSEEQRYVIHPFFENNYGNAGAYIAIAMLTAFLMLTGYLLIYNVMYISVSKDVRFYGLLKTVGTTAKQIRRIVIRQVLRLCLIGLPIGCAASAVVSFLIVPAVLLNSGITTGAVVSFSPLIYIGAVIFACLTALMGAVVPAKKAACISPVEALKFTETQTKIGAARLTANGKPYKMALRNISRNRKRAFVVLLSLFLGVLVFTSVMTIIASLDIEHRLQAEYDYDYTISMGTLAESIEKDNFINAVKKFDGATQMSITRLGTATLINADALGSIIDFGTEGLSFMVRGIDSLAFEKLNKTLPEPINADAFSRGEFVIVNSSDYSTDEKIAAALTVGSVLNIKSGNDEIPVMIGGITNYSQMWSAFYSIYGGVDLEIVVSNDFLDRIFTPLPPLFDQPIVTRLDMDVEREYDEQIYNSLERITPIDAETVSRYEARAALQDAETVMYVLGGGVSAILGLIGVFNFLNVMMVGVMARKRELATLESVGMSKRQMRFMLRYEGLGYAAITIFISLTLGNLICYSLFLLIKNVEDTMIFTYPFMPVMLLYGVILLICLVTPEICYRGISKMTIVERLREVE